MVKQFLNLIRWKNLLITGGLILILKFVVFETAINTLFPFATAQFSLSHTILLILSLMFLAGAGYIINDIYDVKADHLNRPGKVIIDVSISSKAANNLYYLLNAIGIGLGGYLGYELGNYQIGFLHGFVAAIFWIYSAHLKGTTLVGNFVIAIASSSVPIIYFGFEGYAFIQEYGDVLNQNYKTPLGGPNGVLFYFCLILSAFAFLLSLTREIVKDIEDQKGDVAIGARTLPIAMGETVAKRVSQLLILITILLVIWLLHFKLTSAPFTGLFFITYCYLSIVTPCIYLIILLQKARSNADYHKASTLIKIIMVSGILTTIIYAGNA